MRRKDIADFLNAERKVSPLMAFSLLIVAGFMAGSFQLVGPRNDSLYAVTAPTPYQQHAMTALATDATGTGGSSSGTLYDSPAPESCTEAIKAALGKMQGPEVTSIDKGQNGTVDACFGAVLKPGKSPSQKTEDYDCVGRSGKVSFTTESAIGKTSPDKTVQKGQCKVEVCQPYMANTPDGPKRIENCGPAKQFGAGQSVNPQSGGVPPIPSGGTPAPSSPTPSGGAPQPNTPTPTPSGSGGSSFPPVQPLDDATAPKPTSCASSACVDGEVESRTNPTPNPNPGATVPSGDYSSLNDQAGMDEFCKTNTCIGADGKPLNPGVVPGADQPGVSDYCKTNGGCIDANGKPISTFPTGTQNPGDGVDFPVDKVKEEPSLWDKTKTIASNAWDSTVSSVKNTWNSWFGPSEDLSQSQLAKDAGINDIGKTDTTDLSKSDLAKAAGIDDVGKTGGISPTDDPNALTPAFDARKPTGCASESCVGGELGDDRTKPAQYSDVTDAVNTKIDCDAKGTCRAYPTDQKDIDALQKTGYTCTSDQGTTAYCVRQPVQAPPKDSPTGPKPPTPPQASYGPGGGGNNPGGSGNNPGGGGTSGGGGYAGGGSNMLGKAASFLGGLMKGLGAGAAQQQQQPAQTCPTDPQQYAQYQQQYNQQLQQYNFQLQQYNYQTQVNSSYGYASAPPPPPAPQPCVQGTANPNGANNSGQCQPLQAQPNPALCPNGTFRQMTVTNQSGMVCPAWQCVTASSTTPTAQISCDPTAAEKGAQVKVTYSCTNAQTSTGYGFTTNGQLTGVATATIDPPEGATGANYAIKCESNGVSSGAQCTVQIAKVSISLRAAPETVASGKQALIGWVTTGMKSCVVSSPDQADFTARNASLKNTSGVATSSPITQTTDFYLNCITVSGASREEKVTVHVYNPGTVSASIENDPSVARGTTATLQWSFPDAPDLSAVALWLYSIEDQKTVALIVGHKAKAGTYTWNMPAADAPCDTSSSIVCGSDLVPGRSYAVLATLYQPVNAGLGESGSQNLPQPQFLDNPKTASFRIGQ